jgi:hypothetical protein
MRLKRLLWVAALTFFLVPVVSLANAILDFHIVAPTSGSISYAGGAAPLVGTGMDVDSLVGLGTPLKNGIGVNLIGAHLNFTTGNYAGHNATMWDFGGGGTITIDGCADVDSDGGPCDASDISGALLNGIWTNAQVMSFGTVFKITGGSFMSVQSPALLSWLGLTSPGLVPGNIALSFDAGNLPPKGFNSSLVLAGEVVNTFSGLDPALDPAPEPTTLALLGSGLIAIALITGRKFRHAKGL